MSEETVPVGNSPTGPQMREMIDWLIEVSQAHAAAEPGHQCMVEVTGVPGARCEDCDWRRAAIVLPAGRRVEDDPAVCPDPQFAWNPELYHYERCSTCGQLAWDHAGSNPRADVLAHQAWISDGGVEYVGQPPPPHVQPG